VLSIARQNQDYARDQLALPGEIDYWFAPALGPVKISGGSK